MFQLIKNENATMSSRDIAEVAGKRHSDVLEAIRTMEPAWVKVTGRIFPLSEYTDSTGRKLPQYELSKKECLYIATKFNDEARAKLIVRWEQLEKEKRIDFSNPETVVQLAQNWAIEHEKRIVAERIIEQKNEQIQLQEQEIQIALPKVEYYENVLNSEALIQITLIADELGMSSIALNKKLKEMNIQYLVAGTWTLYADYRGAGLAKHKTVPYTDMTGQNKTRMHLYWTEKGKRFIIACIEQDRKKQRKPNVKSIWE